jgi:hypothetical protein
MALNITILSVTMEESRGCRNKLIYSKEHTETFLKHWSNNSFLMKKNMVIVKCSQCLWMSIYLLLFYAVSSKWELVVKMPPCQHDDIMQNDTQHSQCNNIKCYDGGEKAVKMNNYCTIYWKVFTTLVQLTNWKIYAVNSCRCLFLYFFFILSHSR